jgi:hypothetical protein
MSDEYVEWKMWEELSINKAMDKIGKRTVDLLILDQWRRKIISWLGRIHLGSGGFAIERAIPKPTNR